MSKLPIRENVPLAPYTTLEIGGPARFLVEADSEEKIEQALDFSRSRSCPLFVLGGGSNIVVADSGFPGLALKISLRGIQAVDDEDRGRIEAGAGEGWDAFVQHCVSRELAGLECLSGIPGTVGGAPIQNIGAYGEEAGEVILSIRVFDRETLRVNELSNAACRFSYRSSIFSTTHENRYIILKAAFALRPYGPARIHYKDLQQCFWGRTHNPSLGEVREAVLQIRKAKAMVVSKDDPDSKSVGSFFKNPVLSPEEAINIEDLARAAAGLADSEGIPRFPAPEGKVKLPAAWFVEHAGFHKGYQYGNAGISSKHALAIINRGGATAQDIVDLMHRIQSRVRDLFGIELKPEPVLIGFGK